jgi:putative transposase
MIEKVRNYIKNQEIHHSLKSYDDEIDDLIRKHGFDKFKDEPME